MATTRRTLLVIRLNDKLPPNDVRLILKPRADVTRASKVWWGQPVGRNMINFIPSLLKAMRTDPGPAIPPPTRERFGKMIPEYGVYSLGSARYGMDSYLNERGVPDHFIMGYTVLRVTPCRARRSRGRRRSYGRSRDAEGTGMRDLSFCVFPRGMD